MIGDGALCVFALAIVLVVCTIASRRPPDHECARPQIDRKRGA